MSRIRTISPPVMPVLMAISAAHLINDAIQAVIPASYPILQQSLGLSYSQLGIMTFVLYLTSSVMQPVVGWFTDRRPSPGVLPAGMLITQDAAFRVEGVPLLVLSVLLGGWAAGAIGLITGTLLPPGRVGIMFALIISPLLFTGGTQYPWPSLDRLPWFHWLTALNPMTYASEGVRAALEPQVPHIEPWLSLAVLTGSCVVLTAIGMAGFRRRALG